MVVNGFKEIWNLYIQKLFGASLDSSKNFKHYKNSLPHQYCISLDPQLSEHPLTYQHATHTHRELGHQSQRILPPDNKIKSL